MRTTIINHETRGPYRVRYAALGTSWVREFHDLGEAATFALESRGKVEVCK